MHRSKDQILLENIYNDIATNSSVEANPQTAEVSDYEKAERILADALERFQVYVDPSSEVYKDAVQHLVATIQHSPEEEQETAEKLALSLDEPEANDANMELGPDLSDDVPSTEEEIYGTRYESNTILNAYKMVLGESKKKKNNEYAICTASVGRKNEAKYKRCKKKVKKEFK
jgi:hypothetical protein